ncbi:hypothetical protein GCM10025882_23890 [Acinetobacter gyllenbergii]|nr:hypothetical protein GCM10025882_23890 [Acinetobacter gyllenbergii]
MLQVAVDNEYVEAQYNIAFNCYIRSHANQNLSGLVEYVGNKK